MICYHTDNTPEIISCQGLFQLFAQGGGQNEIAWIIGGGGKYVPVCKACGKLGESRGMFPREILILELLLDAIWWNPGLFSHKHNLPFIVLLKRLELIYM